MSIDLESGDESVIDQCWAVINEAVERMKRGEEPTDEQKDDLAEAASIATAAFLMEFGGVSADAVEEMFWEREWSVVLRYEAATGQVSVEIVWDDNGKTVAVPFVARDEPEKGMLA